MDWLPSITIEVIIATTIFSPLFSLLFFCHYLSCLSLSWNWNFYFFFCSLMFSMGQNQATHAFKSNSLKPRLPNTKFLVGTRCTQNQNPWAPPRCSNPAMKPLFIETCYRVHAWWKKMKSKNDKIDLQIHVMCMMFIILIPTNTSLVIFVKETWRISNMASFKGGEQCLDLMAISKTMAAKGRCKTWTKLWTNRSAWKSNA